MFIQDDQKLNEAIQHCLQVADECELHNVKCAKDHRQLAKWLQELQKVRKEKYQNE